MHKFIVIFILFITYANASIALVTKSATGNSTAGSNSISDSFPATSAGATLLVISVSTSTGIDPGGIAIGCSDTVNGVATNNNWHHTTSHVISGANGTVLWYSYNSAAGSLVTGVSHIFHCTGFTTAPAVTIWSYAFSGTKTLTDPKGNENGAVTSSPASSLATGTVTPAHVGDLLFTTGAFRSAVTYTSSTITATDTIDYVANVTIGLGNGYTTAASTSAIGDTWTMGSSGNIADTIVVFSIAPDVELVTKSTSGNHTISSNTTSDTYAGSTAGASLLAVVITSSSGIDPSGVSCSDTVGGSSTGNNWHHNTVHKISSANGVVIWYAYDSGSSAALVTGATHVVTCAGFTTTPAVSIWSYAFSNIRTSSTPFVTDNGATSLTQSLATGNVTPSQAGDLLISYASVRGQSTPYTSALISPVDNIGYAAGAVTGLAVGYTTAPSTSAVADTWTTPGTTTGLVVGLAVFKAQLASTTASPKRRRVIQ